MKGNMFLGYARGSVGDVVFARTGGQQVGRARNRKPNNPKTKAQVAQRALFADAVKFFTHGRQALFKFAFEDKQAQESDYNAFMRINAKRGIMLSPDAISDSNYPAIGRWCISKGSLSPLVVTKEISGEYKSFNLNLGVRSTISENTLKISDLTELMVATGEYEVGDIITLVKISSIAIHEQGELEPISTGDEPPKWDLAQFVLDPSDTRQLGAVLERFGFMLTKEGNSFIVSWDLPMAQGEVAGAAAVHSRKSEGGLKVSTADIVNSDGVEAAILYASSVPYKSFIYSAWSAADDAILEGSVANASK